METTPTQHRLHQLASASLVLLIVLCVLWELVLAPLRPGGSWMVIKALPLLAPLPGTLRRNVYTMQWSSMAILIYTTEALTRITESGWNMWMAILELILSITIFVALLMYLKPIKEAAKAKAKDESKH